MEAVRLMVGHAWLTDFKTGLDKFDVTVLECVINDPLVFLNRD